jgi:hypothetical protein
MIKITNFVRMTQNRWASRLSIVGLGLFKVLGINTFTFAQKTPVVYVAPIEGIIDLGLAPFVQRRRAPLPRLLTIRLPEDRF